MFALDLSQVFRPDRKKKTVLNLTDQPLSGYFLGERHVYLTGNLTDAHIPIATNHLGRTRAVAARVGGGLGVPSRADRGRNLPQWSKNR